MSEREIQRVWEEQEELILDHWSHKHPLALFQTDEINFCWGCRRDFHIGEKGYGCSKRCGYSDLLDEECAEMARKILHPNHPQHILEIGRHNPYGLGQPCTVLELQLGYSCTSPECKFVIDMKSVQADREVVAIMDEDDHEQSLQHPSHPRHPLVRLSRRCTLRCDACGNSQKGVFYACFVCQYWIHQKCALLPDSIVREAYHPHLLSLSFRFPLQYIRYGHFQCGVCDQDLVCKYWIYHCTQDPDCRFAIHIKCAQRIAEADYLKFPINDVVEEQIKPFVKMMSGGKSNAELSVNVKYEFHCHKHKLSLITSSSSAAAASSSSSSLICDGCITPIVVSKSYMSCSECKYYLHQECFHLPPELPSLPLHPQGGDHNLILKSYSDDDDKLEFWRKCSVCRFYMNGLVYSCTKCSFKADIKCASLPDRVYHYSHPQHLLSYLSKDDMYRNIIFPCGAGCGSTARKFDCYVCGSCTTSHEAVHVRCVVLPASVKNRRWDEHPLLLSSYSYDASHPLDFFNFFCDYCEEQMNPQNWMYHCRDCNTSFHPNCLADVTGEFRNIKFGQQYMVATEHPHPLTYHLLTLKRRCDTCGREAYGQRGFQCASCYFFICLDPCAHKIIEKGGIQICND